MKFKRTVTYTGEESLFTPEQFLLEVNNDDRSSQWTPYDLEDLQTIPNEIISEWMDNEYETWSVI
jgi:hypothetical protein